jgi:hypothetical protein
MKPAPYEKDHQFSVQDWFIRPEYKNLVSYSLNASLKRGAMN